MVRGDRRVPDAKKPQEVDYIPGRQRVSTRIPRKRLTKGLWKGKRDGTDSHDKPSVILTP